MLTIQADEAPLANRSESANQALVALKQLTEKIGEKADLNISCLEICNQVTGFGQYSPAQKEQLQSGKPQRILVYCEVENFSAQLNAEGKYYTQLHADITLYGGPNYRQLAQLSADVEDTPSFNRRHDFFLRGPLELPQLTPGQYEIVVTIEDKIAHKIAKQKRYHFEVQGNLL